MAPRPGGSGQPGLPTDYGGGGVASSGPGTVHGHNPTPPAPETGSPAGHSPGQLRSTMAGAGQHLMTVQQVRSMQQFLVNKGFEIPVDGVMGPLTKSAALAFRMNHASGPTWSAKNGMGVHPGTKPLGSKTNNGFRTADLGGGAPGYTDTSGAGSSHGGGGGMDSSTTDTSTSTTPTSDYSPQFIKLLNTLLAGGGNVGTMLNPAALGAAAAAPDNATAAALAAQIGLNPKQERQNQYDLSSWYGLNPNDPNFAISVLGRLGEATGNDVAANTAAANNMGDIAKALAASIGGSANPGSTSVDNGGLNDAGAFDAIAQSDKDFQSSMTPLLQAEARGQMAREKAANAQTLSQLKTQLGTAKGQAVADAAAAAASARGQNNSLAQQRFANQGNLLSTLAGLMATDPNAAGLADALKVAEINHENASTAKILTGKTTAGKVYKIDMGKATQGIINQLGYQVNKQGQPVVPTADHIRLAHTIGAYLRSQGFKPGDGQFKKIGDAIFGSFVDQHGRPLIAPPTWAI